jgi:NAD+ kinase
VLLLVKRDDDELVAVAVEVLRQLIEIGGVQVLIDHTLMMQLANYDTTDLENDMIRHFDPKLSSPNGQDNTTVTRDDDDEGLCPTDNIDLVVTLGGDGLLMHAAHIFSGPVPPVLSVAGGSLGFLTPFAREEMLAAILISLGLQEVNEDNFQRSSTGSSSTSTGLKAKVLKPLAFESNKQIYVSNRMRLDCRIFGSDGSLRARYSVLNEVVIDRGSSPFLANLETFCDGTHLTTVQADGVIFATPTGSTAYSMAAGGPVVHPEASAVLVTPICPHVLSFRPMILPDSVVLRCFVPSDARSTACASFDGKHRTELHRGDSVEIKMSAHPLPTINKIDASTDWLSSLKRSFGFNARVRQKK